MGQEDQEESKAILSNQACLNTAWPTWDLVLKQTKSKENGIIIPLRQLQQFFYPHMLHIQASYMLF